MKKMKLDMDELRVDSFDTDAPEARGGTVRAFQTGFFDDTCHSCAADCGPTRAWSCRGYGCTDEVLVCHE